MMRSVPKATPGFTGWYTIARVDLVGAEHRHARPDEVRARVVVARGHGVVAQPVAHPGAGPDGVEHPHGARHVEGVARDELVPPGVGVALVHEGAEHEAAVRAAVLADVEGRVVLDGVERGGEGARREEVVDLPAAGLEEIDPVVVVEVDDDLHHLKVRARRSRPGVAARATHTAAEGMASA